MANKYLDATGLSHFYAKIKALLDDKVDKVAGKGLSTNDYTTAEKNKLSGIAAGAQVNSVTGVKGKSESSYRTGNVNITADNVNAIEKSVAGNTSFLSRPNRMNGTSDNTLDGKINSLRANRLAFLPADQIIIEKTTDGGTTWVDANISDATKTGLFSETRASVNIPLLNGVKSQQCGLRITFSAMKYNVPSGTAETNKYNYWSSEHVASTERYNQIKEMYFWISANSDTIGVELERATGAKPNNWVSAFNDSAFLMTGWSGSDYIRFSSQTFGGSANQPSNYWNYRLTLMTKGTLASGGQTMATTYTTTVQQIMEIRGYGDTYWTKGNEYAATDKIYTHDYQKNVTFPAGVTATKFTGTLNGEALYVTGGAGTADASRHVWFSDSGTEKRRVSSDNFMYNPATDVLKVGGITGSAAQVNGYTVEVITNAEIDALFT